CRAFVLCRCSLCSRTEAIRIPLLLAARLPCNSMSVSRSRNRRHTAARSCSDLVPPPCASLLSLPRSARVFLCAPSPRSPRGSCPSVGLSSKRNLSALQVSKGSCSYQKTPEAMRSQKSFPAASTVRTHVQQRRGSPCHSSRPTARASQELVAQTRLKHRTSQ